MANKARKGAQWERDVARLLTEWINGEPKPLVFWRGRGSGAMFTKDNQLGEAFSGDIYAVREEGRFLTDIFSIECKSGYKNSSFDKHLKFDGRDTIHDFWKQTAHDAAKSNKQAMLIVKKTGNPPWVGLDYNISSIINIKPSLVLMYDDLPHLMIFDLKRFFSNHTPGEILQMKDQLLEKIYKPLDNSYNINNKRKKEEK